MEKTFKELVVTAATVLTKRWQTIEADRRSRREPDGCDELTELSIELTASDGQSETSARVAILDSAR